jgi:integration host factor subunit beta
MEQLMNKSELIKTLADENAISVDESTVVVNTFFDSVKKALLENRRVEIRGLGSFKIKEYQGYSGRNPKTGEVVSVAPKKLPFFRAGKELKEYINS